MQTSKFIGTIGILVIVIPLLGVPTFWKTAILVILGFLLVAFAVRIYRRGRRSPAHPGSEVATESYVENRPSFIKNRVEHNGREKV